MRRRAPVSARLLIAGALLCMLGLATAALASARDFNNPASQATQQQFDPGNVQRQDTPNDPDYDYAESDDEDSVAPSTNIFDEAYGLFGFPSERTRATARYLVGPHAGQPQISGFNASGAWKLERGRADAVVAILDTGIQWNKSELRQQVHLNTGELPLPASIGGSCTGSGYDCNNDGVVNVDDYATTTVDKSAGIHGINGTIDAEDLIATFNDGDSDGNGFADDIAGWDFFDNDNNPYDASSYFAAGNHGSGRATDATERGNDGSGSLGTCPGCQFMPIRVWDTFVTDGNGFGMGILYGTDNGAAVIEGANGSVYHSAFAEAASQYAYDHNVAQTFSGDDLNTGNHNYAANYSHVQLIQGTAADVKGLGMDAGSQFAQGLAGLCSVFIPPAPPVGCPGSSLPVGTYFRGANTTQFGGKSSIAMEGATGSENTGKAAGAAALVISAARNRTAMNGGPVQLHPDETREILEQTAETVYSGNTLGTGIPDPGVANPNAAKEDTWTSHFGWGRVNLGDAVQLARNGKIPPEAAINSPDWYAPATGTTMPVTGLAKARFADNGNHFSYTVQWGLGQAPTSWNNVSSGTSSGTVTNFGSVDMNAVRSALASFVPPPDTGGPVLSATNGNPFAHEFTVRIIVTGDGIPTKGIDRRVFTSAADPTLRNGFPKRMGTGGEAPIRYADINGDNVEELVVPAEDGKLHMYEPDGSEAPGSWPVATQLLNTSMGHSSAPGFAALSAATPPREPLRGAAVADLDDDGRPEIIDTAGTHLYVWEPDGSVRTGFPKEVELANCAPSQQSQVNDSKHPKCGFIASPAVGRFKGPDQPLAIVAPAGDGRLYGWDGDGNALPGLPKQLIDPGQAPNGMVAEAINEPAIEDLNGDGTDDIVAATNETYDAVAPGPSVCGPSGGASDALANAAGGSSRVYAVNGADGSFLSGWPVKLNGAIQDTLPLIGPGQNPAIGTIGGEKTIVASTTGSASIEKFGANGSLKGCVQQGVYGPGSDATDRSGTINLFESASLGKLDPASGVNIVKYGLSITDVANLLLVGQNLPYNHLIGAYNAQTGASLPAFPKITDDFQFLSSSNVAKVDKSLPQNQILAGTGLGLIHAYDGITGADAAGFPKVTGGWLFAPSALSDDGRIADITREGYLFQWNHAALPECQTEWPSFRHDQQQSGNYDRDGTQPYKPTDVSYAGTTLSFKAPGDDYGCGTATTYEVVTSDNPITPMNFAAATPIASPPVPAAPGTVQTFQAPVHKRYIAIRAVDEADNVGWSAQADTGSSVPPGGGGGGSNGGGGAGAGIGAGGSGSNAGKTLEVRLVRKGKKKNRRVCYKLAVSGTDGTIVAGALADLAGRQRTTGAGGLTKVCARKGRRARRMALTVSAAGYAPVTRQLKIPKRRHKRR